MKTFSLILNGKKYKSSKFDLLVGQLKFQDLLFAKKILFQGCHGTGKTGNLKVHFARQGKHREFAKKY